LYAIAEGKGSLADHLEYPEKQKSLVNV
jgi:hypothetical protein